MAAVTMTTPAVSNKLQRDQERGGLVAPEHDDGGDDQRPAGIRQPPCRPLGNGARKTEVVGEIRPTVAMVALIIAVSAKAMRANFATLSGVANVSRPCDQRLISQAPASAAIGVPSAMQAASESAPLPTTVEKNAPTKIAGQIR